jgi:hypothetical protein
LLPKLPNPLKEGTLEEGTLEEGTLEEGTLEGVQKTVPVMAI